MVIKRYFLPNALGDARLTAQLKDLKKVSEIVSKTVKTSKTCVVCCQCCQKGNDEISVKINLIHCGPLIKTFVTR